MAIQSWTNVWKDPKSCSMPESTKTLKAKELGCFLAGKDNGVLHVLITTHMAVDLVRAHENGVDGNRDHSSIIRGSVNALIVCGEGHWGPSNLLSREGIASVDPRQI